MLEKRWKTKKERRSLSLLSLLLSKIANMPLSIRQSAVGLPFVSLPENYYHFCSLR